jgi:hypothetical protein
MSIFPYVGLLSPSSCRNQLTNGFELVKIRSTNPNSFFPRATVERDWQAARAWLFNELSGQ